MMPVVIAEPAVEASRRGRISSPPWLGWLAFALSLAALVSGVLPHYLFGEPLPNPFERRPNPPPNAQAVGLKVHLDFQKDNVIVEVDEVKEAVKEQAADAKERVGQWAKGLKKKIGNLRADPERPADALHPENQPQPAPEPPVALPQQPAKVPVAPVAGQEPIAAGQPARWSAGQALLLAAVLLAIASLPIAMASWIYEQQRPLPIAAIGCSTLAVTWQYLVFGLILGVAAAIFIYLIWTFVKFGV